MPTTTEKPYSPKEADQRGARRNRQRASADPLAHAYTIEDAQRMGAPGRTKLYELFNSGELLSIRVGRRRMIVGNSLRASLTP